MRRYFLSIISKRSITVAVVAILILVATILRLTYFSPKQKDQRAKYYYSEALKLVYSDPKAAEKYFAKAVSNDKTNSGYLWQLAIMETRNGRGKQAAKNYEKLLKNGPSAPLYKEAADVYLSLDERGKAKDYYRRSIELDPSFEPAIFSLADALDREGRKEEALAVLKEGMKSNPGSSELNDFLKNIETK